MKKYIFWASYFFSNFQASGRVFGKSTAFNSHEYDEQLELENFADNRQGRRSSLHVLLDSDSDTSGHDESQELLLHK